jgi:hypothetical protein
MKLLGTPKDALAWMKKVELATAAAHLDGVPCFVEAVTGERLKTSWWGHPKGKLIFALGESLDDAADVVSLKLLEGKATLVHAKLWPLLLAVVLDETWRAERAAVLPAPARALWKKVEGESRRGEAPGPVKALEESLLVHCASEHTEKGRHEKRLTGWAQWAKDRGVKPASCGRDAAIEKLRARAAGHALGLD